MTFPFIECGKNWDENTFYRKVKIGCEGCLNKNYKCLLCGKFFEDKLSIHIEREHQRRESDSNMLEKPTISANNKRTLIVGPSNVSKTH